MAYKGCRAARLRRVGGARRAAEGRSDRADGGSIGVFRRRRAARTRVPAGLSQRADGIGVGCARRRGCPTAAAASAANPRAPGQRRLGQLRALPRRHRMGCVATAGRAGR